MEDGRVGEICRARPICVLQACSGGVAGLRQTRTNCNWTTVVFCRYSSSVAACATRDIYETTTFIGVIVLGLPTLCDAPLIQAPMVSGSQLAPPAFGPMRGEGIEMKRMS